MTPLLSYLKIFYNEFTMSVSEEHECSICLETFTFPIKVDCSHTFCKWCISRVDSGNCPLCRQMFDPTKLRIAYIDADIEDEIIAQIGQYKYDKMCHEVLYKNDEIYRNNYNKQSQLIQQNDQWLPPVESIIDNFTYPRVCRQDNINLRAKLMDNINNLTIVCILISVLLTVYFLSTS